MAEASTGSNVQTTPSGHSSQKIMCLFQIRRQTVELDTFASFCSGWTQPGWLLTPCHCALPRPSALLAGCSWRRLPRVAVWPWSPFLTPHLKQALALLGVPSLRDHVSHASSSCPILLSGDELAASTKKQRALKKSVSGASLLPQWQHACPPFGYTRPAVPLDQAPCPAKDTLAPLVTCPVPLGAPIPEWLPASYVGDVLRTGIFL